MTTPSPAQQFASDVSALNSKVSRLQDSVRLAKVRDNMEDLQTKVNGMAQRVTGLRQRGYVFEKKLEEQAADFARQWTALQPSVAQQVNIQAANLQASIRPIEMQMTQLNSLLNNPAAARPVLTSAQSNVSMLEDKVSAAERTINGMFDQFSNQVSQASRHLDGIESMLKNLAEASFQLLPTEAGIAAVKAVWCRTGKEQKEDPEGVLFLTDQRVLFEQKQEVATKKVLFVTTEKKKVQSLLLEAPVALLDVVATSKAGMLKNEDHIEIRFQPRAPVQSAHFHIWQDCALWQGLLNRAKSKDFDKDRALEIDQAELDKVKAAPTQCPSCGAVMTAVVLRGQDSLKCEYCGAVIRL